MVTHYRRRIAIMKSLLIVAACGALSIAGCATTLQAHSDHDAAQSFAGYHTYAWLADQPMMVPADELARVSPLNRRRIEQAIENELASKGFEKSTNRSAADFVVSYTVGARDRVDVHSYPAPYAGPWHWGSPYFGHDVDVTMYREGTLAIDVFDGKSHQPVWHGWASKRISERDVKHAAEQIPPAVTLIMKDFPPR
jgi:uncharacterized protein DUF4136